MVLCAPLGIPVGFMIGKGQCDLAIEGFLEAAVLH